MPSPMPRPVPFDREKFKTLVHYVCWRCQDPTKLGATKLNKVLWFVDTLAYQQWGRAVTGEVYIKRQFGPVPQHVLRALEELQHGGALAIRETQAYGYPKREFFALTKPDISGFSPDEISLIDQVTQIICDEYTAGSISALTHDDVWKLAQIGEQIPYHAVLAGNVAEVTEEDVAWARHVAGGLPQDGRRN